MPYQRIESYGMIGDMHSVALVSMEGSIDWLCFPHFDSPAIFAALLDDERGGRFSIAPEPDGVTYKQFYWPDTNVLVTRFYDSDGVGEVIDFMPVGAKDGEHGEHQLVRRVRVVRGRMAFRMRCRPAFNFAHTPHRTEITPEAARFATPELNVGLATLIPLEADGDGITAAFTLEEGQTASFLLSELPDGQAPYDGNTLDASNLLMPLVFFVAPNDPRMLATLDAIDRPPEQGGLVANSLVYRYDVAKSPDGLDGEEGTFNICTFWLVEALTRAGRTDRARLEEARRVGERTLDFGTTGRLRFSNLIMYDRQTESWWQQATGEAIAGEFAGAQLTFLPAAIIAWEEFFTTYRDGQVLSRETGFSRNYGRNPYQGYDDVSRPPFLYDGPATPGTLPATARVLTVDLGGEAVAYPYEILEDAGRVATSCSPRRLSTTSPRAAGRPPCPCAARNTPRRG